MPVDASGGGGMNAPKLIRTCSAILVFSARTWTRPSPETAASTASKVARDLPGGVLEMPVQVSGRSAHGT
jgi:hypothetical protein